ncbi:hypothetical protein D8S78_20125 [Natrialba swarupiae]|nr:hypothetical protein [Natrialba swarupiae]
MRLVDRSSGYRDCRYDSVRCSQLIRGTTGLPSPSLVRKPYFKWYIAAGVATTFGLLAAFSAIQIAPVAIAVPLIQTSPLLVIVLSMLFLSSKLEKVTPAVLVSTVIIIVGATIVTLVG